MKILMIAATAGALGIVLAPPVWADEDTEFVDSLRRTGFAIVGSGGSEIELGHWVCDNLDAGFSPHALMYSIQESSARLAGTPAPDLYVRLAIGYLCPQHSDTLP